jgi:acyl-CoA thioesterase FadM
MFETEYEIGDADIQPVYEHVNHAQAVTILETARRRLLDAIGHPLDALLARGCFLVVTRIQVEYKRELVRGCVRIVCEEGRLAGKSVRLTQRVINARGKEAVLARIELKFMRAGEKFAVPPPGDFAGSFARLFPESQEREAAKSATEGSA